MAVDVIEGIEKEPEEVKFKGIDLATNWLEEDESVKDAYVSVYRTTEKTIREIDLSNVRYIEILAYDANHHLVEGPDEWEMTDAWHTVKFIAQGDEDIEEVTEDILVDTGSPNPDRWIRSVEGGKYKIGVKNGELGAKYHVTTRFETEAGRVELIHFPVEIVEVKGV